MLRGVIIKEELRDDGTAGDDLCGGGKFEKQSKGKRWGNSDYKED